MSTRLTIPNLLPHDAPASDRASNIVLRKQARANNEAIDRIETIDRITAEHRCEVLPTAAKVPAIRVLPRHSAGEVRDRPVIAACRKALEDAGISTDGWLS
jgi:hypothetical protein